LVLKSIPLILHARTAKSKRKQLATGKAPSFADSAFASLASISLAISALVCYHIGIAGKAARRKPIKEKRHV